MSDKVLLRECFTFNRKDNSGESLSLTTSWIDNGDDYEGVLRHQELTLQSYCNSASFNLIGAIITPEALRELANKLEQGYNRAVAIKEKKYEKVKVEV